MAKNGHNEKWCKVCCFLEPFPLEPSPCHTPPRPLPLPPQAFIMDWRKCQEDVQATEAAKTAAAGKATGRPSGK